MICAIDKITDVLLKVTKLPGVQQALCFSNFLFGEIACEDVQQLVVRCILTGVDRRTEAEAVPDVGEKQEKFPGRGAARGGRGQQKIERVIDTSQGVRLDSKTGWRRFSCAFDRHAAARPKRRGPRDAIVAEQHVAAARRGDIASLQRAADRSQGGKGRIHLVKASGWSRKGSYLDCPRGTPWS